MIERCRDLHLSCKAVILNITFGTDGWRAILNQDFTEKNVERVTTAIGKYIADNFGFDKPVLIGYDPRNKAEELSLFCAEILKNKGFNVFYSSRIIPTPVLAYSALVRNACAIMFTASHNPPEYLGMKFIPDYAGPATAEITDEIVGNIDKPFDGSGNCGSLHKIDFAPRYYEHIEKLIDFDKVMIQLMELPNKRFTRQGDKTLEAMRKYAATILESKKAEEEAENAFFNRDTVLNMLCITGSITIILLIAAIIYLVASLYQLYQIDSIRR